MSSHEGVSCDACGKNNFRFKRYKCLICYDYDLCSMCFEQGETSSHHKTDHPVQCILTRHDFDSYYHGERYTSDQPQSLTCPFCGEMGFALPFSHESSLMNSSLQNIDLFQHIQLKHGEDQQPTEVICPICASMVNGEPNLVTADLLSHIANDHQQVQVQTPSSAGSSSNLYSRQSSMNRDFDFSGSSNTRASFRRGPLRAPSRRGTLGRGGGTVSQHFIVDPSISGGNDPIADLLTQLSAVRRLAAANNNNSSSLPSSNPINLPALTRQQYERERLRAAGRSHHSSQQSGNHPPQTSNSNASQTGSTSSSSAAAAAASILPSVDSDFFDSLFSSALCIDSFYSPSSNHQTWAQIVAQQQTIPVPEQLAQQTHPSCSISMTKPSLTEPDPSLLRKLYDESSVSVSANNAHLQQQKRRNDFVHNLLLSSFLCPLNDNDK